MNSQAKHKWTFRGQFVKGDFGWRSQPAINRFKEAVVEIKNTACRDPVLGAEGAVLFLEKYLQHLNVWTVLPAPGKKK